MWLCWLGLSCSTWSLSLRPAGFSLVVARGLQLPCGMWDLSYPTGDQTCGPALKGGFSTTETTREVPPLILRLRLPGFPTGRSCALSMEPLINSFSTEEPDWCQLISRRNEIKQSLSLVAQKVRHLPAMWETQVQSVGQEDPWRRKWQHTLVLLPGESQGQKSLAGHSPQCHKDSDVTEWLHFHFSFH